MMKMTAVMMNRAGKSLVQNLTAGLALAGALAGTGVAQQAPLPTARGAAVATPAVVQASPRAGASAAPAVAATPLSLSTNQSSLTVQQIVARQEDHFATIKNAQGIVVHSEVRFNEQGQQMAPKTQYIFFAYAGKRSVTLTMPEAAARVYRSSMGKVPWRNITSAYHVTGDTVYRIEKPEGNTSAPRVIATAFNPAVHENNPLVAFHPRQISDEQISLRDLARAIPNMAQRPTVTDVTQDGKAMVRIDFANPQTPAEHLFYVIDPARGYLPVRIARMSGARPISMSTIVIGHTPDGTWIPARRERIVYDASGRPVSRQNWHYEYLAVNEGLAPKALSLMYFNLPLNTKVEVVGARNGAGVPAATPAVTTPAAATRTPAPRVAPTPLRVPLN